MVRVQKLTAEALLSEPRRGPAVPNARGTLALYTLSTHTFGKGTAKELRVMNMETGSSKQLSGDDKVHDAVWIPAKQHDLVLYLRSASQGRTQVFVASGRDVDAAQEHYLAADLDAPVSNLKLGALNDGSVAFVVTGLVDQDGSLYNEETAEKTPSTERVFDTPQFRMSGSGKEMYKPQRYGLWYNKLVLQDGKWKLHGQLFNLVQDPTLEAPAGMYGGDPLNGFDVSQEGIAFTAKSLKHQRHENPISHVHFAPLESFSLPPPQKQRRIALPPGVRRGGAANIRFTPDSFSIGFLHAEIDQLYNTRLYMAPISSPDAFDAFGLDVGAGHQDYSPPSAFEFAGDSDSVILKSRKCGRWVLSRTRLHGRGKETTFFTGGANAFYPLVAGRWDTLLVTSSSFIESSLWQVVDVSSGNVLRTVSSASKNGVKFGLSPDVVTDFWYEGADDFCIHCWMIRPSDFDGTKKFPWVLWPRGGTDEAWNDQWSIYANAVAWAEQGYIVILPNITGSAGYGLEFIKRIRGEWGGKPFKDLTNLFTYVERIPYIDQQKAVLVGSGGYSGYLVNWCLGHDVINKFCCAVSQSSIFNLTSCTLQSDSLVDLDTSKSPYPWDSPELVERWNPARADLLRNWKNAPPTLVVQNEQDHRTPITEGLAVFNTLQAQGVPSRLLTFADEGHAIVKPENLLVWYSIVWDWVRQCIDGDIRRGDTVW